MSASPPALLLVAWGALACAVGCKPRTESGAPPALRPGSSLSASDAHDGSSQDRLDGSPKDTRGAKTPLLPKEELSPKQEPGVAEGSAKKAPGRRYVVAALGDSITDARVGGGGYLQVLREACPESEFINFGKGGDMTNQMLRRLRRDILPQVAEQGMTTLLVYGGVNDLYSNLTAGRTNERIQQSLSEIYQLAHDAGLEVVAVTVSPWGGFRRYFNQERSENTRLLNSWILGQAGRTPPVIDRVVDSYPLLSCGDPEVLCPDYETRFHDGLHPGPEGQRRLGEKLAAEAFADCR